MADKTLKEKFIELILEIEDEELLHQLYEVMKQYQARNYQIQEDISMVEELKGEYNIASDENAQNPSSKKDWWNELSGKYKEELIQSLEEMKQGINVVSHYEATKRIRKWAKR